MKKLPYKEGDVIAVPLHDSGYALGVVARSSKQGRVLFGYFFGKCYAEVPKDTSSVKLTPGSAVLIIKFGDLGLMNGTWKVVAGTGNWDRTRWPMPKFLRRDDLAERSWLVTYDEDAPQKVLKEEVYDDKKNEGNYSSAGLYGAGAVEIALTRIVGPKK